MNIWQICNDKDLCNEEKCKSKLNILIAFIISVIKCYKVYNESALIKKDCFDGCTRSSCLDGSFKLIKFSVSEYSFCKKFPVY